MRRRGRESFQALLGHTHATPELQEEKVWESLRPRLPTGSCSRRVARSSRHREQGGVTRERENRQWKDWGEPRGHARDMSEVGTDEKTPSAQALCNDSACGTQYEGVVSLVPAGCGATVCREQAEETPPSPLTGRSAKCGNGREVTADHEAFGQEMHQELQESEVADVRRLIIAERRFGPYNQVTSTAKLGHGARSHRRRARRRPGSP